MKNMSFFSLFLIFGFSLIFSPFLDVFSESELKNERSRYGQDHTKIRCR